MFYSPPRWPKSWALWLLKKIDLFREVPLPAPVFHHPLHRGLHSGFVRAVVSLKTFCYINKMCVEICHFKPREYIQQWLLWMLTSSEGKSMKQTLQSLRPSLLFLAIALATTPPLLLSYCFLVHLGFAATTNKELDNFRKYASFLSVL